MGFKLKEKKRNNQILIKNKIKLKTKWARGLNM